MHELQSSQEIILFQDAMQADYTNGVDFTSTNPEMVTKSVQVVLDILSDIKEMCEIDGKLFTDIEADLHCLLLNKTLLSTETIVDEERKQLYLHVCKPMPDVGWNVYVKCIVDANWLDLAEKIWTEESASVQFIIYDSILKVMTESTDVANVKLFYAILYVLIDIVVDYRNLIENISDDDFQCVSNFISTVVEKQDEFEHAAKLIDVLTHFCLKLKDDIDALQFNKIGNFFQLLIMLNSQKFKSRPQYKSCKTNLMNCASAVNEVILRSQLYDLKPLHEFQNSIKSEIDFAYRDEEEMIKDALLIDSHPEHCEGLLTRVLEHLKTTTSVTFLECLLRNHSVLQPHHVHDLIAIRQTCDDEAIANRLLQIIEFAFKIWSLNVQDNFRKNCVQRYSVTELLSTNSNFDGKLTKTINFLASTLEMDKLNEVTNELSFLCLQNPVKTLSSLMSFAIESGQGEIVAKLMAHLVLSCRCVIGGYESSLGTSALLPLILIDVSPQQHANIQLLIKEIISNNILQPEELFKTILCNLKLDDSCYTTISVLEEIMKWCDEKELKQIFEQTHPSIVLLKLGRIIHYCTTVEMNKCQVSILPLKQQAVSFIRLVYEKMKRSEFVKEHHLCWLYMKLDQMDSKILYYFDEVFSSHSYSEQLLNKVGSMSLSDLLVAICSCESEQRREKYLNLYTTHVEKAHLQYHALCYAVAKVLPRLIESECEKLPDVLASLLQLQVEGSSPSFLVIFQLLTDAILLLLQSCNVTSDAPLYFQLATANCTSIIKNILRVHQPMKTTFWISTVCLIANMTQQLETSSTKFGELLLVDVLTTKADVADSATCNVLLDVIKRLNNRDLTDQVTKLFKINEQ